MEAGGKGGNRFVVTRTQARLALWVSKIVLNLVKTHVVLLLLWTPGAQWRRRFCCTRRGERFAEDVCAPGESSVSPTQQQQGAGSTKATGARLQIRRQEVVAGEAAVAFALDYWPIGIHDRLPNCLRWSVSAHVEVFRRVYSSTLVENTRATGLLHRKNSERCCATGHCRYRLLLQQGQRQRPVER